jgi:hypothetical protein
MIVKFALLADYAALMTGNKLLIVGEFDSMFAPQVPLTYGPFFMVARLDAPVSEGTEHRLQIGLYDEDGHLVGERTPETLFRFNAQGPGRPLRGQFLAQLVMTFPKHGTFEFHIVVDGRTETVVPVHVIPPPPKANGEA